MAVKLAPIFNDAQLDNNGLPLSGGLLTWYQAGTTTEAVTYTDSAGFIPQTSPIILNVRGEPDYPIWLTTGINYKAILSDATGNVIRIVDNLSGVNDTAGASVTEWVLLPATATYISATSFSVAGDKTAVFTASRRIKATVSGGVCYATITGPIYAAGVTTVTVVNDATTLDSGLSAVYYGFMDPTHPSFNSAVSSYAASAGTAAACTGNSATATYATTAAACTGNAASATYSNKSGFLFEVGGARGAAGDAYIDFIQTSGGAAVARMRKVSSGAIKVTNGSINLDTTGVQLALGGTAWAALSDNRLKDIIEPIQNASQKVSTLSAVIGKYKTDAENMRRSFLIAQDVQAVLPEAVFVDTEGQGGIDNVLCLEYTSVIPLLVAAIKEQQAMISALTDRITALEAI